MLRIKYPKRTGLITVTEDLNGMIWEDAKELLEENYDIKFDNMALVLRTQDSNGDGKQMIPLTLGQTIIQLNEDNVLFMSNSEKIKSGYKEKIDPDDYPNTVAGLKLLVSDMEHTDIANQNMAFKQKLRQISSAFNDLNSPIMSQSTKIDEELDELENEEDEIFNQ